MHRTCARTHELGIRQLHLSSHPNLVLAARAVGLGTVLTTNHTRYETEIKTYLGIPDEISTAG